MVRYFYVKRRRIPASKKRLVAKNLIIIGISAFLKQDLALSNYQTRLFLPLCQLLHLKSLQLRQNYHLHQRHRGSSREWQRMVEKVVYHFYHFYLNQQRRQATWLYLALPDSTKLYLSLLSHLNHCLFPSLMIVICTRLLLKFRIGLFESNCKTKNV